MRILILGAAGLLGSDLVDEWPAGEAVPATSGDADIRELSQVRRLVKQVNPGWIVLAAAYADVDGCERDPERAFAVNRDGAENVARVAQETGAKLVYFSTDYLFDGKCDRPYEPTDTVHPLNVYGASKAAGELAVQQHAKHWIIARTSWLFGAARSSFPEKILLAAEIRPNLEVVNDQVGSPTYTKDLARAVRELLQKDACGILHITNAGSCSWFDFATEILRRADRRTPVMPIRSAQANRLATRPAYSVLSPATVSRYGIALRSWQAALDDYLGELRRKGKLR